MHLLYPQICFGCGTDQIEKAMPLCTQCVQDLPFTDFFSINENPIEKIFWGRTDIQNAGALLFFTTDALTLKSFTPPISISLRLIITPSEMLPLASENLFDPRISLTNK